VPFNIECAYKFKMDVFININLQENSIKEKNMLTKLIMESWTPVLLCLFCPWYAYALMLKD